jgi:hypothetical protein
MLSACTVGPQYEAAEYQSTESPLQKTTALQ